MILATERLYLREMEQNDFNSLCKILQDEETMYAYEGAFSDIEVRGMACQTNSPLSEMGIWIMGGNPKRNR